MSLWSVLVALLAGLLLIWLALVAALALNRPDDLTIKDAVRLLPDVVRLVKRLAADRRLPRGVRVRLYLLLVYLVLPIDIIPDFIPVVGYADDAVIVALVLRSVVRRAGADALERNWPGTADGLAAVSRLARLPAAAPTDPVEEPPEPA
jgi:uncharacterized membrane protein YkvA (DUF1232 family)